VPLLPLLDCPLLPALLLPLAPLLPLLPLLLTSLLVPLLPLAPPLLLPLAPLLLPLAPPLLLPLAPLLLDWPLLGHPPQRPPGLFADAVIAALTAITVAIARTASTIRRAPEPNRVFMPSSSSTFREATCALNCRLVRTGRAP